MDFSTHLRASGDAQSTIDLRSRHLAYLAAAMGHARVVRGLSPLGSFDVDNVFSLARSHGAT